MKKLRNRFLISIILPVIFGLIAAGFISFFIARHIIWGQLTHLGSAALQQAADEIDSGLGNGIQALNLFAMRETVADLTKSQLKAFFDEASASFGIEGMLFVLLSGEIITSSDKFTPRPDYHPLMEPWFADALDSTHAKISAPTRSPFSDKTVVMLAQKITTKQGITAGVLAAAVPISKIQSRLPHIRIIDEVHETIFSMFIRNGTYLFHSDEKLLGRKLGESNDELHIQMRQALSEEKSHWIGIGEVGDQPYFGGFQKSRYTDMFIAIEIPLSVGMRPIYVLGTLYIGLGIAGILVLSLVVFVMARWIAKPINMLTDAAIKFSKGDYNQKLPVTTDDELGLLVSAFNEMSRGIRQRDFIRDTFGRYVTQEIADQVLDSDEGMKLGGQSIEISMLISDLRGFSAHTLGMPPEKILFLLNRYLEKMIEILLDHGAVVDEIQGDGILAFFGAPLPMRDHPTRAVACALTMQSAMAEINERNAADGLPRLEMGIGINTGVAVVGNIGSERRTKYGVVGSEINFAGRIESFTHGGQILISESTYNRVKDHVEIQDTLQVEPKGFSGTVMLYDVVGISGRYNVRFQDRPEEPMQLSAPILVQIRLVQSKVVDPRVFEGSISAVDERSVIFTTDLDLKQNNEIRMEPLDSRGMPVGEAFARILVTNGSIDRKLFKARFTFVAPETRRMFRSRTMDRR
jgi:sigma-B regulation protein RsbU (phosphoserine phosphatase)